MPYKITHNADNNVLECFMTGTIHGKEALEMVDQIVAQATDLKCMKILTDSREAEVELSVLDFYKIAMQVTTHAKQMHFSLAAIRRAHVGRKSVGNLQFFETVSVNRGQNVRVFYSLEEAREWIVNGTPRSMN